jgi:hypothetical protein
MKGMGTDEDAIIEVLTKRSAFQRAEIIAEFKNEFGRVRLDDFINSIFDVQNAKLFKMVKIVWHVLLKRIC